MIQSVAKKANSKLTAIATPPPLATQTASARAFTKANVVKNAFLPCINAFHQAKANESTHKTPQKSVFCGRALLATYC